MVGDQRTVIAAIQDVQLMCISVRKTVTTYTSQVKK